jgi:hypothetical protein
MAGGTRVRLCFVPCAGGEIDYVRDVDLPGVPQAGDYVTITDAAADGAVGEVATFRVRRTWWNIRMEAPAGPDSDPRQLGVQVAVECEFARGHYATAGHLVRYEEYARRSGTKVEFDTSMY